jgi:bifunctional DNase/RNase
MFVEMKVFGMTVDPFTNSPIVILKDLQDNHALPIWIGLLEASAIAAELESIKLPRPMTHDLLKSILNNLDANVEKIEVCDLKNNVFYAIIHIHANGNHLEIDARPSDAIAVALRTGSPIFVNSKVIEKSKKIDMRNLSVDKDSSESEKWKDLLENLNPEDFGKYKM